MAPPIRPLFALTTVVAAALAHTLLAEELRPLPPGQTLTASIARDQAHRYALDVRPGDLAIVTVMQKGIDVTVVSGDLEADLHSTFERYAEVLPVIAGDAGPLTVEVRSLGAPGGGRQTAEYDISYETRQPDECDRMRVEALRELTKGRNLADPTRPERLREAMPHLEKALALSRGIDDRTGVIAAMVALGTNALSLRENKTALRYFEDLLPLILAEGKTWSVGMDYQYLGWTYDNLGQYQKALEHYQLALDIIETMMSDVPHPAILGSIGLAYLSLGDPAKALAYYEKSLDIFKTVQNKRGIGIAYHDIGQARVAMGEWEAALSNFERALAIHRETKNTRREVQTLLAIARVRAGRADSAAALAMFEDALRAARKSGDPRLEGIALDEIGELHLRAGAVEKALDTYRAALAIQRTLGDRSKQAVSLFGIARGEKLAGRLDEARAAIEECLDLAESIRGEVEPRDLRLSFRALTADYYETQVEILMALHDRQPDAQWAARALEASERGRARVMVETLQQLEASVPRGVDPKLHETQRALLARLADKEQSRVVLAAGKASAAALDAIDAEVRQIHVEMNEVRNRIRSSSPRYAALVAPDPPSLKRVRRELLDDQTALVEFALGGERSFLWVVTRDRPLAVHRLPRRKEIEAAALQAASLLGGGEQRKTQRDVERALGRLGAMVLGDVDLPPRVRRLVIVPDGALHYVPFAALSRSGERALIQDYEISVAPSASTLLLLRNLGRPFDYARDIAVIADPVFTRDDPRVTGRRDSNAGDGTRAARFTRLPATRWEAKAIATVAPAARVSLDFDARPDTILGGRAARASILHIATHAFPNAQDPDLSGIALSMVDRSGRTVDGFVRLRDLYGLTLDAELVVLSACRTAMGKDLRGEGIVGLVSGFMYAGTPRVIASYWDVKDRATAELMQHFYRSLLAEGKTPAAALRESQLAMRGHSRWGSPYYWAAFALYGEWR